MKTLDCFCKSVNVCSYFQTDAMNVYSLQLAIQNQTNTPHTKSCSKTSNGIN